MTVAKLTAAAHRSPSAHNRPEIIAQAGSHPVQNPIESVKHRVLIKRLNGQRLTVVERHLTRNSRQLERRLFAPSFISVSAQVVRCFS